LAALGEGTAEVDNAQQLATADGPDDEVSTTHSEGLPDRSTRDACEQVSLSETETTIDSPGIPAREIESSDEYSVPKLVQDEHTPVGTTRTSSSSEEINLADSQFLFHLPTPRQGSQRYGLRKQPVRNRRYSLE